MALLHPNLTILILINSSNSTKFENRIYDYNFEKSEIRMYSSELITNLLPCEQCMAIRLHESHARTVEQ
jgi:hypothetical protein